MRGYKGMTKDMTCHGMQFEVGKTYHVDGKIELCRNGLHFCQKLVDVFYYYNRNNGNRFFEVETDKPVFHDDKKSVAAELTILRELTDIEVNRAFYGYGNGAGNDYFDDCGNGFDNDYKYGYGNSYAYGNGHNNNGYCGCFGDGFGDGSNGYGNGNGYGDGDNYNSNIQKILVFNN